MVDQPSSIEVRASESRGFEPRRKPREEVTRRETRELPNNVELEKAILAVLLDGRHATAMSKVRTLIEHPLAFFQRDHRMVYLACLELDDAGQRIDVQSVCELLSRYPFQALLDRLRQQQMLLETDQLDTLGRARLRELYRRAAGESAEFEDSALAAMGGFTAVSDLMQAFGPVAGIERNVALLWDYYLKRRLILRLQALCDKAYRTPEEFPKLVDEGSQAILDLGRHNRMASVHGIDTAVDEALEAIQRQTDNPELGVKTGIGDLDDRLMSLRPGGLYVLAARPGVGKTSLALKIVSNIVGNAESPSSVLFFSLEVDRIDLVKKMLSAEAGVDFRALETGAMQPHELELVAETATRFKGWPLSLMDVSDLTVHQLRAVVRRQMLETRGGLKLVVLDYLQLLNSARPDASEYEKVSEISRVLKVLARDLRIPGLALSQMSRDSEKGVSSAPREPRLSDLRGSGSIEQDADAVIFMHRTDQNDDAGPDTPRKMKVIVAKNRFGPTGGAAMDFFPAKMRFAPASSDDGDEHAGPRDSGPHGVSGRRERLTAQPKADEDLF